MITEDRNEETIFDAAVRLKSPAERDAYLSEACSGDDELRSAVGELLKHHEVESFLDVPPVDSDITLDDSPISEAPGTVIDKYKLLERIGEGGMAVVYMAEQQKPIRRKVALKIIKLGMDTNSVIARFEAERQALAMMDHPNIAKVLDAGATETGRPYFVMELVTGVSITEYCDKNNLSTKERLALFVQVSNAVQHAHQKGVIHRDIKPSNVMVAHHDGRPVPKVIDFGIAKATNQRLTEKTLFTRYAHIIGTPAYMSPEQAQLSDLGIDSRSDIYSLGVLLYELLTGTTPFSEEELRKAGYLEMQRIIREQEPAKPSTKLSTLGETLTDIAKRRGCTPDLLTKTVRGDLDWIVMKALEKDRARRYEGASSFALDIERHLEHRPVSAHAPSASYRAKKFLRRNRLQTVAGLAAVLVLCAVIVLSLWNRHQVRLAEAEGARQVNALSEARRLVTDGDLSAARQILVPIIESKHVGLEARNLLACMMDGGPDYDSAVRPVMVKHHRERVQYFSGRIQAQPADPNNYLRRSQQYKYLREEENVHADMSRYATILGQEWFSRFRFGTPRKLESATISLSMYRLVLSIGRRENGILVTSIAFGQKGRSTMKTFEVRMLLASAITLCLFPGLDTPVILADFTFGEARNLETDINTSYSEVIACVSKDGLEMYFDRKSAAGKYDIYVSRRAAIDSPWGAPDDLGPLINTSTHSESGGSISADGLTLYFTSDDPSGYGSGDIWVTTRATDESPWASRTNIGQRVNSSTFDGYPFISTDGLELYFVSYRAGGCGNGDIWVTRRATKYAPWDEPVNLGQTVNSVYYDTNPLLSPDGLLLFFSDHPAGPRPGGYGGADIWIARRATLFDPWQTPVNLGPMVNGPFADAGARLSPDGSTLFFTSNRPNGSGDYDIWQAPILPVVDFNGDGRVDGREVLTITDQWGLDDPICDIGPTPFGDGIVDLQDVIALADYLGEEVHDTTLMAHWALDEAGGFVASDSARENDAFLSGNAIWHSDGGVVGGAIELDGVDDCLMTPSFMDPAAQPFSVLAWVKGGAPGQVIISQSRAGDWLCLDPVDGSLMSKLSHNSWNAAPLASGVVITDGQWHRVGFVWDGITRVLYVDEQEVIRDGHPQLASSEQGLVIGGGAMALAGTYFSGMIDDVRIYNRVVRP